MSLLAKWVAASGESRLMERTGVLAGPSGTAVGDALQSFVAEDLVLLEVVGYAFLQCSIEGVEMLEVSRFLQAVIELMVVVVDQATLDD